MAEKSRLPTKLAAYQAQCWNDDRFTGFQCADRNPDCPLIAGDTHDDPRDALAALAGILELDHLDDCRFSATGTTIRNKSSYDALAVIQQDTRTIQAPLVTTGGDEDRNERIREKLRDLNLYISSAKGRNVKI